MPPPSGCVHVQAGSAIRAVDPTLPETYLGRLVSIGFGTNDDVGSGKSGSALLAGARASIAEGVLEDSEADKGRQTVAERAVAGVVRPVDIRTFCRRLLYSYPTRYGPPPKRIKQQALQRVGQRGGAAGIHGFGGTYGGTPKLLGSR